MDIQIVNINDDFYPSMPEPIAPTYMTPIDETLERIASALERIAVELNTYNEMSEM